MAPVVAVGVDAADSAGTDPEQAQAGVEVGRYAPPESFGGGEPECEGAEPLVGCCRGAVPRCGGDADLVLQLDRDAPSESGDDAVDRVAVRLGAPLVGRACCRPGVAVGRRADVPAPLPIEAIAIAFRIELDERG